MQTNSGKLIKDKPTELKILSAAREVFHRKGFEGTRMQEIADKAGINKAMLHYYFRNKDKLFDAVFEEALKTLLPRVKELLEADMPLFDKLKYFCDKYITLLMDNLYLPVFVIFEMYRNPDKFLKTFTKNIKLTPEVFVKQINDAVKNKQIKKTDPKQVFVNLMSMCVYPLLAKPLLMKIYNLNEKSFVKFIQKRKKEIPEFVINSLKIEN